MKNLEIFLNDGTKVFECIISNHTGIVAIHHNTIMPSLQNLVQSVIDGTYSIEFKNRTLDTSKTISIFDRVELFKNEENFKISFDVVTPQKVLEYVYEKNIPIQKDIEQIVKHFGIKLEQNNSIKGIGEALLSDDTFTIRYKKQYYKQRERFTIAHELGHIFLHFSTDKKVHFIDYDDELEEANNTSYKETLKAARNGSMTHSVFEKEADDFARELLVPEHQLKEQIENYITTYREKPTMSYLKRLFGVSCGAMFYALQSSAMLYNVIDDCRYF